MNDSQGTQAQFVATTFATANEWDGAAATAATAAAVASSGSKWIEESSSIGDAKDIHFSRKKWSSEMESWKPGFV